MRIWVWLCGQEGDTVIGNGLNEERAVDIELQSPYIQQLHCVIRHTTDDVHILPHEGATCSVNNKRIQATTKLNQGV